ncbi:DUF4230 domain-containing protein [Pontibacter sp. G13]|uniref:DUF4230 domain-containing protein n=1 Tax=Pontibacter sp. G13 TaxID=3074898 RepID=UPI00288BEFC5|nr:DUF4230 domain-containing protein [Pontibacter sp. G13]WNJ21593.1 DUF4230 domain-containing protein [Pontibacter sp. G13]
MIKRVFLIILSIALVVAGGILLLTLRDFPFPHAETESEHHLIVQQMERIGKVELVKYHYQDIVRHEIKQTWLPDPKVLLVVQGEAVGCVDFAQIDSTRIQLVGDTLEIDLPDPELCHVAIDHRNSRVFDTEYTLFSTAELVDEAYRAAERELELAALRSGIIEQTRDQAQTFLAPILATISGKPVKFRFAQTVLPPQHTWPAPSPDMRKIPAD